MFQARGAGRQRLGATAYLLYSGGNQGASVARVEYEEEEWAGDQSEAPEKPTLIPLFTQKVNVDI